MAFTAQERVTVAVLKERTKCFVMDQVSFVAFLEQLSDQSMKVEQMTEVIKFSYFGFRRILRNYLIMHKVNAKQLPEHLLSFARSFLELYPLNYLMGKRF